MHVGVFQFFVIYDKNNKKSFLASRRLSISRILTKNVVNVQEMYNLRHFVHVTRDKMIETDNIKIHRFTLTCGKDKNTYELIDTLIESEESEVHRKVLIDLKEEAVSYVNKRRKSHNF